MAPDTAIGYGLGVWIPAGAVHLSYPKRSDRPWDPSRTVFNVNRNYFH